MNLTKRSIVEDLFLILTKFGITDETRLDEDWASYKIDDVRALAIDLTFKETNVIDQAWLSHLGLLQFYKTNPSDNSTITTCGCDISKTTVPQIITLNNGHGNQDLGLVLMSTCGKKEYTAQPMQLWRQIPEGHTLSRFNYRWRIGTDLYINKPITGKLNAWGVLRSPEDAFFLNTAPVASGSIVSGTVYLVKYGQVIYNGNVYQPNSTFTGTGVSTFTTSKGFVYPNTQVISYRDTDPYPVSPQMARWIITEICKVEFGIESQQIADLTNDSQDDSKKAQV